MKLLFSTLALAAMAGSASAKVVFDPPLGFTQFDGDCETGEPIYEGSVVSIEKISFGNFCVTDKITVEAVTFDSFSKVEILGCEAGKIYEIWHKCEDSTCGSCEAEYNAYTNWESIAPDNVIGYCYDYTFSADPISATTRSVPTFDNVRKINFSFNEGTNFEDAQTYVEMMDENSCIVEGEPEPEVTIVSPPKDTSVSKSMDEESDMEEVDIGEADSDSGACTLAATAAVATAAATAMFLI